ncbi:hypothetical protein C5749_18150 [Sphingobacterium gobiense]|uniref:Uncharacterized protein n=1 Tax=Sphingobacterium gobiense TaxID=1382456 RepID=A0A2S9JEK4_9SPHI|nr:hypothetical protein C5749_18150 [Sphingobacterium gobiense]
MFIANKLTIKRIRQLKIRFFNEIKNKTIFLTFAVALRYEPAFYHLEKILKIYETDSDLSGEHSSTIKKIRRKDENSI